MNKNVVWWLLLVVVILCVGAALIIVSEPGVSNPEPGPSVVASTPPVTTTPSATPTAKASSTPKPKATPTWHRTKLVDGKSTRNTLPFTLKGQQVRATVIIKGKPAWASIFAAYVEPLKGTSDFATIGPFTNGTHRKLALYLSPGTYYLAVVSANCKWHVTIWELY